MSVVANATWWPGISSFRKQRKTRFSHLIGYVADLRSDFVLLHFECIGFFHQCSPLLRQFPEFLGKFQNL